MWFKRKRNEETKKAYWGNVLEKEREKDVKHELKEKET